MSGGLSLRRKHRFEVARRGSNDRESSNFAREVGERAEVPGGRFEVWVDVCIDVYVLYG